jgi:hypothetical protein
MRPKDVRECVEIVAAHPVVGPRYGSAIADLRPVWLHVLAARAFCGTAVFEEVIGSRVRMLGVGATLFVSDHFIRDLKTPPFFWMGPELVRRIGREDYPLLYENQVREANSRDGLNLAVWQCTLRMEAMRRVEVWNEFMTAFLKDHCGYLIKELVAQGESVEHLLGMRSTGSLLWQGSEARHSEYSDENLDNLLRTPHVIGMTRQLVLTRPISWVGSLFRYEPPQCGFSPSEQRLLLAALDGGTDEALSDTLAISLDTVKKTWRLIYERVAGCLPELVPGNSATDNGTLRGKEKKHRLLAYLRQHPEELRPVSRKLLPGNSPQLGPSFLVGVGNNTRK